MSVTLILVILIGFISYQAFEKPSMKSQLCFYPVAIKGRGEWYRFLTHGFVHGSWMHLGINLFVLYQFGEIAEYVFGEIFGGLFGKVMFVVFYLSAVIVASIPSYFKHQNNAGYSAVGASGATSALVFIYVFLLPWEWFVFPPLPAILLAVGYLWYSSYMDKQGRDNIGHNVHFWGAIFGIFFIVISAQAFKPELIDSFLNQLLSGPKPHPWFS